MTRRGFLAAALAGGAAALAGCTSVVSSATSSGTGAPGGTLVLGSLIDILPKTLLSQSITTMTIGGLIYDSLIRYDLSTLTPQPAVATGWDFSDDQRVVELTLRDDVTFHSGRQLTSEDVAYSLQRYAGKDAGSQLTPTASRITSIETPDAHRIILRSQSPIGNIFDLFEFALLLDSKTEAEALDGTNLVGTGPFVFDSRDVGSRVVLKSNPSYWDGKPPLDGVEIRVIRDAAALLSNAQARQVDLVLDASPQRLRRFRHDSAFTIEPESVYDVAYYVGVNVADEYLSDRSLRQAISFAVDRDRILHDVFADVGFASSAPWAQQSPAFDEAAAGRYRRDVEKAKALLKSVDKVPSSITLSYPTGLAVAGTIAAIVQNNLADIGIKTVLDPREQAAFSPFLNSGQHQLWINPHGFGQSHPLTLASGAAPFKPAKNLSGFSNPAYTAAVAALEGLTDLETAKASNAFAAYTDILLEEQFIIDLVITTSTNLRASTVQNLDWNAYKYLRADKVTVN